MHTARTRTWLAVKLSCWKRASLVYITLMGSGTGLENNGGAGWTTNSWVNVRLFPSMKSFRANLERAKSATCMCVCVVCVCVYACVCVCVCVCVYVCGCVVCVGGIIYWKKSSACISMLNCCHNYAFDSFNAKSLLGTITVRQYLPCDEDNTSHLHNQFPWKSSFVSKLPFLKRIQKIEFQLRFDVFYVKVF